MFLVTVLSIKTKNMVYDCFCYNGEADILEMRLNILDPYVDYFVLGEAAITFSSMAKPLYFELQKERFKKFLPKIRYQVVENYYSAPLLRIMAQQMDFNTTSYPFLMAFYQKEYLQAGLEDAQPTDTVYYGDVDEIWTPQQVQEEPAKLEQLVYSMYLNRRSEEPWRGTAIATAAKVKQYGLSQIRLKSTQTHKNGGWHFTNMGGLDELKRKIASYDHQEVNTSLYLDKLEERYKAGTDFLGRNHKHFTDESEWPQYLKDNRQKYAHLLYGDN